MIMNTSAQQIQMNKELWQSIGYIADDESLMRRLTRYAKKLAKERKDPTLMSEEEFLARVDESKEEYENGNYHTFASIEDLDKYIRSL